MRIVPYVVSTALCLSAYVAMAFVANRERLAWPMLYAGCCAALCMVALIGIARPEFVSVFSRDMVPLALLAAGCFAAVEAIRNYQHIASATEGLVAMALLSGVGISLLGGELLDGGYSRLLLQTAAVVVPIAIVIATLGVRPLPEPITAPIVAYAPMNGLPVPEVSQ